MSEYIASTTGCIRICSMKYMGSIISADQWKKDAKSTIAANLAVKKIDPESALF